MNLGHLDPENEEFINNYKEMGYSTKTQLANEAIKNLRRKKMQQLKEQWRREAFAEIAESKPDLAFSDLDGDDFVINKTR
jgi:hypothetical protein